MATTLTIVKGLDKGNTQLLQWLTLAQGETGDTAQCSGFSDKQFSFVITGTAPTSIVIEGTLETGSSPTFHTLRDSFENTLSLAANTLRQIHESCEQIRPRMTGGDGTTSVAVIIHIERVGRG